MSFIDLINSHPVKDIQARIDTTTPEDIARCLLKTRLTIDDFVHLIAPAITNEQLEQMARKAHQITTQRFGRTIQMYAPIYLSNECHNGCKYCGFSADNHLIRRTLTFNEAEREAQYLSQQGFRHLLLLTGEAPESAGIDYLESAIHTIKKYCGSLSIEVFPMDDKGYERMVNAGVDGLTLYQETYNRKRYQDLHPYGPKSDYLFRLEAPERAGIAGMRRIGIGALLGLDEGLGDIYYTALHALYLAHKFWKTQVTISFPRLRPAQGGFQPKAIITDRQLTQFICALRLLLPDAGLILSTRESTQLRNNLLPLGITQMSSGSSTAPGGYSLENNNETEQFAINDERSPKQLEDYLHTQGYEAIWKDWDAAFLNKVI